MVFSAALDVPGTGIAPEDAALTPGDAAIT